MYNKLGIIGGMGPLATVNLFKRIVFLTDAKKDQEHLEIIIDNNTSIPDRTSYILGKGENPKNELIKSAKTLEKAGAEYLVMPCNTAHYFYNDIAKEINIPLLNMIEETTNHVIEYYRSKKIGLLSTEGTSKSGVYDKYFNKHHINLYKLDKEKQRYVSKFIYDIKEGCEERSIYNFKNVLIELKKSDIEVLILGCTELSTAYDIYGFRGNFIDPLDIIAKKAIEYSGKKIRQNKLN
ncbi:aspartate/glutamate racemase family protein [Thermohalobacter berrensis]|uniref:Aspartate racemase n=1 Tax=Thermohalobacter berrensis TaxID=99594 RepID=A0A419T7U8_9FIRM|nr:amino acid racemase [Thermohalobacter berrensis]RKD33458.1 aspartate racemase [Thermohalobacter berrensis]